MRGAFNPLEFDMSARRARMRLRTSQREDGHEGQRGYEGKARHGADTEHSVGHRGRMRDMRPLCKCATAHKQRGRLYPSCVRQAPKWQGSQAG